MSISLAPNNIDGDSVVAILAIAVAIAPFFLLVRKEECLVCDHRDSALACRHASEMDHVMIMRE